LQPSVTIPNLKINADRLRADFDALAQIGETPAGGVQRLALSSEDLLARAWFADRLEDAGLILHDDDAGNLSGILPSDNLTARTLMVGSHLDTVPNGGRFDGAVGVIAGLECARVIRESGLKLPVHLEVIDWTDDEGCWRSLFGVRAVTGLLQPEDVNDVRVDNGPFRAALSRAGIDPRNVFAARRDMSTLMGYLELHIEQGQRLERTGTCIGAVTGIVGRATFRITFHGEAAHSGTTDMVRRRDALRGAALFITRAHEMVRERYPEGIFNCGKLEVEPGAFNIIPSKAQLTVEVRHVNERLLNEMVSAVLRLARECAADHLLTVDIARIAGMLAADMDERIVQTIEMCADELGLSHMRLVSYSGHAAQMTARAVPQPVPSGMIFIPSIDGISHNPHEYSRWEDVVAGTNLLLRTLVTLALNYEG
jgi:N-carbamoyl-L-amino-acid hydrolase